METPYMNHGHPAHPPTLPPTTEEIVARAHRIWIEAGRPQGRDREHWEEAERQLRGNTVEPPREPQGKETSH